MIIDNQQHAAAHGTICLPDHGDAEWSAKKAHSCQNTANPCASFCKARNTSSVLIHDPLHCKTSGPEGGKTNPFKKDAAAWSRKETQCHVSGKLISRHLAFDNQLTMGGGCPRGTATPPCIPTAKAGGAGCSILCRFAGWLEAAPFATPIAAGLGPIGSGSAAWGMPFIPVGCGDGRDGVEGVRLPRWVIAGRACSAGVGGAVGGDAQGGQWALIWAGEMWLDRLVGTWKADCPRK